MSNIRFIRTFSSKKICFLLVLFLLFALAIYFHPLVPSILAINFFLLLFLTRPIASSSPLPPAWF